MKKYITIILTLVLVSCTKSAVTYDEPGAIGIQPVSEGMTKAAVGVTPAGQDLLIYANYTEGQTAGTPYLNAAVFSESGSNIWMGKDETYFWPKSGKITLSGCTALPSKFGTVEYSYADNTISIQNYKQSLNTAETVDFIWFNQTEGTNLDRTDDNLAVVMNHALTWVTIQVKGFGGSEGWKVESVKLLGLKDTGTLTCRTTGPEWTNVSKTVTDTDIIVFKAPTVNNETNHFTLEGEAKDIENTAKGTVLIPQTPVQMEVKYHTTDNPTTETLRTKTLDLQISENEANNFWAAGKHYIYTVTFNPYKITFSVAQSGWGDEEQKDVKDYVNSEIEP